MGVLVPSGGCDGQGLGCEAGARSQSRAHLGGYSVRTVSASLSGSCQVFVRMASTHIALLDARGTEDVIPGSPTSKKKEWQWTHLS